MSQKIQIRRGLESERASVTPDTGELLYTTDLYEIWVGDGSTVGGLFIGGGSTVGYVQRLCGTQSIASSADSVTVSGLTLASAPSQVLVSMRKVTGGLNLFATVRSDSISTAGFTADLSGITDASTYQLDYLVIL
jgi:hypothetical protein